MLVLVEPPRASAFRVRMARPPTRLRIWRPLGPRVGGMISASQMQVGDPIPSMKFVFTGTAAGKAKERVGASRFWLHASGPCPRTRTDERGPVSDEHARRHVLPDPDGPNPTHTHARVCLPRLCILDPIFGCSARLGECRARARGEDGIGHRGGVEKKRGRIESASNLRQRGGYCAVNG